MLDAFEIVTTSGIVLWRKHYAPISSTLINNLINDVFIEERQKGSGATYRSEKYTLRFTTAKDVGLIFVVCNTIPAYSLRPDALLKLLSGSIPIFATSLMGRQPPHSSQSAVCQGVRRCAITGKSS